jgi:HAD superfamily hydrolase (TIGR01509 family)
MADNFSALIFDLDGVIIDSEPLHAEAKRRTFQHYGIQMPETIYAQAKGTTDFELFGRLAKEYLHDHVSAIEMIEYKDRVYSGIFPTVKPVPGALDFLLRARARFSRMALTTSARRVNQQRAFDKFGLARWFDVVVTAEDIQRGKPDPDPYLKTLDKLGLPASACLVIEDSTAGVRSGGAAGCAVAGITTSFSADELASAGAAFVVESFDALAQRLSL